MREDPRWQAAIRNPRPQWALYALILLLDVLAAAMILGGLVELGDWIEDLIWPGGVEWID